MQGDYLREVELLSELRHPSIVEFRGAYWPANGSTKVALIITELMDGSVASLRARGCIQSKEDTVQILADVAEGLQYLHDSRVVHMDVKPENVLVRVDSDGRLKGRAKIADFGVSRKKRETAASSMLVAGGTYFYVAPEGFGPAAKARPPCDVWSFGVLLWELLSPDSKPEALVTASMQGIGVGPHRDQMIELYRQWARAVDGNVLRELAQACLITKPADRPRSEEIRLMLYAARRGVGEEWVARVRSRSPECLFGIGRAVYFGWEVEKDARRAWMWLQFASAAGSAAAQHMLLRWYEAGTQ
jgi:serine/threonine protein kinase